jgi:oxygen-dependent protoporphyrinogen oxidase
LQVLPETIAGQLTTIHYGTEVSRIQKGENGLELIAGGIRYSNFDRIFLNAPLYRINDRLLNGGGELHGVMKIASYPPLSVIVTGYKREQIEHPLNGFGFLVPARENRKILGSLFNSSLFPNRAPDGHVMLTTFVGGARQPELASKDTPELKRLVCREHEELLGASGEPAFFDHIYWPNSIPQYTTGYDQVLDAIENVEKQNPGIHLIGNFRGGIALPDCIETGLEVADNL